MSNVFFDPFSVNPDFELNLGTNTPQLVGSSLGSPGFSQTAAREDHQHQFDSSPWVDYSSSISLNNITLGGAGSVLIARYKTLGKTVLAVFAAVLGAGGAVTGRTTFSAPIQGANGVILASGYFQHTGVFTSPILFSFDNTTVYMDCMGAGGVFVQQNLCGPGNPFVWVAGDVFVASIAYETV